jgi:Transposase
VNLIRRPFKWNGTCLRYARVRSAHSVISVRPRFRRISAAWAGVNNCGRSSAARSTAVKASTPHGQRSGGAIRSAVEFLTILFKLDLLAMSTAVDRFPLAQLANNTVTAVRRRVTVQHLGRRGRKGDGEWELRNGLTRSAAKMHANQLDPMVEALTCRPKAIGVPILAAWNVKEDLMDLLALTDTSPCRGQIFDLLAPVLRVSRRLRPTRDATPRQHRRHLVAAHPGCDPHWNQQRCRRSDQPGRQDHLPPRLRLP